MNAVRHDLANVRTPDLKRAVADYTEVLGFECLQHIPGVCALVAHGPLQVQLWASSAAPGRWERPTPGDRGFVPGHHRVEVPRIDRVAWWPDVSAQRQPGAQRMEDRS